VAELLGWFPRLKRFPGVVSGRLMELDGRLDAARVLPVTLLRHDALSRPVVSS